MRVEFPPDALSGVPHSPLVVGYYTRDEWADLASGRSLHPVTSFVSRASIQSLDVTAAATERAPVTFEAPPGDVMIVGFVDTHRDVFHAMLGGGTGDLFGTARGRIDGDGRGEVVLRLQSVSQGSDRHDDCEGDRVQSIEFDAPEIVGTVGNDVHRHLCVYLPPSYARASHRRYPVFYFFPGLMGDHGTPLMLREIFDAASRESNREAIVVGIDTRAAYGSSYLTDSPRTGNWEQFVTHTVVQTIDRRFRTLAQAMGRVAMGHSTGGFNAVWIGMRHPEVFGTIAASSPDALDFATWMLESNGATARPLWRSWIRLEDAIGGAGQLLSYANEWSPDPERGGVHWPIDLETGAVLPEVWARWMAQSPITWLDESQGLANARRLSGHIYLTCGRDDDFDLFRPTQRYDSALTSHGIAHEFVATPFGHIGHAEERFRPLVLFALRSAVAMRH